MTGQCHGGVISRSYLYIAGTRNGAHKLCVYEPFEPATDLKLELENDERPITSFNQCEPANLDNLMDAAIFKQRLFNTPTTETQKPMLRKKNGLGKWER